MDTSVIRNAAKKYLVKKNIAFLEPGKLGDLDGDNQEVVFLDPLTQNPNVATVDPCDIKVTVNLITSKARLVEQM